MIYMYVYSDMTDARIWIGANDINNEGTFTWVASGQLVKDSYSRWHVGDPNNIGGLQNCVQIVGCSVQFENVPTICH